MSFSDRNDLLLVLNGTNIEVFLYKKKINYKSLSMTNPKITKMPVFGVFSEDQKYLTTLHSTKRGGETYLALWNLQEDDKKRYFLVLKKLVL